VKLLPLKGACATVMMTFDATLKDMGRDSPRGFLAAFDRPPTVPIKLLNVDLSTVTMAGDLILGLGEPLTEIVQLDFQSKDGVQLRGGPPLASSQADIETMRQRPRNGLAAFSFFAMTHS
jgi:hypothetical protein